jgi:putative solute:sodium symporter small subunit
VHVMGYAWRHEQKERRVMPETSPSVPSAMLLKRYWRNNLFATTVLLAIWFVVTFVVSYFARELSFTFFGWPFSFWMAAQGSLIVYALIVGGYAWYMNRADIVHGVGEALE